MSQEYVIACIAPDCKLMADIGFENITPKPGTTQGTCEKCGENIVIGPRSMKFRHENPQTKFMCMKCAVVNNAKDANEVISLGGNATVEFEKRNFKFIEESKANMEINKEAAKRVQRYLNDKTIAQKDDNYWIHRFHTNKAKLPDGNPSELAAAIVSAVMIDFLKIARSGRIDEEEMKIALAAELRAAADTLTIHG